MYGEIFKLWEGGGCDDRGDDEVVGNIEELGPCGEGDRGATVAVRMGGEEDGLVDGCAMGAGPG